jgi:hypothetical protein
MFTTELVGTGLPLHIAAALRGHLDLATTGGYTAVFPQEVIRHHQQFVEHRRQLRGQGLGLIVFGSSASGFYRLPPNPAVTPANTAWVKPIARSSRSSSDGGIVGSYRCRAAPPRSTGIGSTGIGSTGIAPALRRTARNPPARSS